MSTWYERLKKLREEKNLSQTQLGEKIGKDLTAISRYENGSGAQNLTYKLKQSLRWVFTPEEIEYIEHGASVDSSETKTTKNSKIVTVPIMSVKASAGRGNEHYDVVTTGELLIDRMLFKVLPNLKDIRAIEVEGDSMYPTLKEGDYVIIEENSHFSGDGIYVLQWDSVLLVKRLQAGAGKIDIISDNQRYAVNTFDPMDDQRSFHIVGKVILRMQR